MKVVRYISKHWRCSTADAKALIGERKVVLNGQILTSHLAHIDRWDTLCVDGKTMQAPRKRYYMVNKPVGYVSATNDEQHPTVLSLLPEMLRDGLHIAGRLDKNTTGLLLLTNDGRWSRAISSPASKVGKDYLVGTRDKITEDYVTAFAQGMYFSYEGITTQPATLRILGERLARLTIYEGKYHQIKRMFGRFRNPVTRLHRESIGQIVLDSSLDTGGYRELSAAEINTVAA